LLRNHDRIARFEFVNTCLAIKKLAIVGDAATPHQVALSKALREYFDVRVWFYEYPDRLRGAWWRVDLPENCKVLDRVFFFRAGPLRNRYLSFDLINELEKFQPDVVIVGGFSIPSNYFAVRWAKRAGKKSVVLSERSRDRKGVLRKGGVIWRVIHWLYKDVDMVFVTSEDAVPQFRDDFGFGAKVVAARYGADIDSYFNHPVRTYKQSYTYLFANRLTEIYNPLGALDIFAEVLRRYPESKLVMNAAGELAGQCRNRILELGISDHVEFLTNIESWSDLNGVYARCDILLLPAIFSNGNFTIVEAMASGMGIVMSDKVLGMSNIFENGQNGFVCPPTTQEFLECIELYICQPELFTIHARRNRESAKPLTAAGTAEFYSEMISRHLC